MGHDFYKTHGKNRKKSVNKYIQTKRVGLNEWEAYFINVYENTGNTVELQSLETYEITNGITVTEEQVRVKTKTQLEMQL